MVATVNIVERHGPVATPVDTNKDGGTVRFKNADNATVDSANPMVIPSGGGTDYSFTKYLALKASTAPSVSITNPKCYTDGAKAWEAGVNLHAKATNAYATNIEITVTTGYADAFTYTSATALTLGTATYTASGIVGDFAVFVLSVVSGTTQGQLSTETLTFSYDEI